jgi:hypothetical protein
MAVTWRELTVEDVRQLIEPRQARFRSFLGWGAISALARGAGLRACLGR